VSDVIDVGGVVLRAGPRCPTGAALVGTTPAEDLAEDVGECVLEVSVGHDVDNGVEGGVEVADPEEDGDDDVRTRTVSVATDCHGQVPDFNITIPLLL
jgi:hypothetical protein